MKDKYGNEYDQSQAHITDEVGHVWQVLDVDGQYDEAATIELMKTDAKL